jgi:hypothetical protein
MLVRLFVYAQVVLALTALYGTAAQQLNSSANKAAAAGGAAPTCPIAAAAFLPADYQPLKIACGEYSVVCFEHMLQSYTHWKAGILHCSTLAIMALRARPGKPRPIPQCMLPPGPASCARCLLLVPLHVSMFLHLSSSEAISG